MTLTRIAPSLLAVPCAGAVLRLEDGCPNTKLLGVVFRCPLSQHDPFLHLPKLTGINYVPQYSWRYSYNLLLGQTLFTRCTCISGPIAVVIDGDRRKLHKRLGCKTKEHYVSEQVRCVSRHGRLSLIG